MILASLSAALVTVLAFAGTTRGDRELGFYLSSTCLACHQLSGRVSGGIPAIVGWPEDQFIAAIRSYKDGTRENETMRAIAHALSQEEIEALAAFLGSLPRPEAP